MKEQIKKILEDHYFPCDSITDECVNELFELFVKSNPNADWEATLKAENDPPKFCKCTCSNSLQYSNCDKMCEIILDDQ